MTKLRPQIILLALCVTLLAGMGIWVGWQMGAVEIVIGGIGLGSGGLIPIAMKILENNGNGSA
jgi:hypothetical protein